MNERGLKNWIFGRSQMSFWVKLEGNAATMDTRSQVSRKITSEISLYIKYIYLFIFIIIHSREMHLV